MRTRTKRRPSGGGLVMLAVAFALMGAVLAVPGQAHALSSSAGYSMPAEVYARVGQSKTVSLKMPATEVANVAWSSAPTYVGNVFCQHGSYWGKPASISFTCLKSGTTEISVQVDRFSKLTRAKIGTVRLSTRVHIAASGSKAGSGAKVSTGSKTSTAHVKKTTTSAGYVSAAQAYKELNKFRAAHSRSALKKSAKLEKVAKLRAKEAAQKYSHTRPNGTSCFTAYPRAVYKAENIACGFGAAAAVTEAWAKSPGHRTNMLSTKGNSVGIACYQTAKGTHYWAQCFAKL